MLPTEVLGPLLDQSRAMQTAALSAERLHSAKLITFQYELLKRFCHVLLSSYQSLETIKQEEFVTCLKNPVLLKGSRFLFKDNLILKPLLSRLARVLAPDATPADENVMFEQMKDVYLLVIGQMWGEFFSKLDEHRTRETDTVAYREHTEKQFTEFMTGEISTYMTGSPTGFYNLLQQMVYEVKTPSPLTAARQRFGFIGSTVSTDAKSPESGARGYPGLI